VFLKELGHWVRNSHALEPPSHGSAHLAELFTVTGSRHLGGLDGVLIAKADGHSIPQIDHADQDREINDLFVGELRLQRPIGVVRRVRVTASVHASAARSRGV
jgi:hypothetical protein